MVFSGILRFSLAKRSCLTSLQPIRIRTANAFSVRPSHSIRKYILSSCLHYTKLVRGWRRERNTVIALPLPTPLVRRTTPASNITFTDSALVRRAMADEGGTVKTEEPPPRKCCDMLWIVTTKEGWLKLVEAIMTLLTFSILASDPINYRAEYEYLIFVATTAFIFVVLHIVLRITHLFEKLPSPLTHPLIGFVGCFLASLALLVGSAISFARGEQNSWHSYGRRLKSSGICGFISTALFFFEGVYYIFLYRRLSRRGGKAEVKEEDDFVQPPEKV